MGGGGVWGSMGDCYLRSTFLTAGVRPAPNLSRVGARLAVLPRGKAAPGGEIIKLLIFAASPFRSCTLKAALLMHEDHGL
jgi:hypothetical protein